MVKIDQIRFTSVIAAQKPRTMILSTSHNFVFIHIAKNGGSTIRSILEQYGSRGLRRSHFSEAIAMLPFKRAPENLIRPPHVDATWVRNRIGAEMFDNMFTFAVVRNPYDQVVSRYLFIKRRQNHHAHKAANRLNFSDFIRREARKDFNFTKTQFSKITDRAGREILSKVYRFENYAAILPDVLEQIGLPKPEKIPHEKQSVREPYQAYYDTRSRQFVEKYFKKDLDYFGYSFD
ncbi:MAG: sulfotransferase family 2 domain-containing protein [Pseudomonadota bacterium]